VFSLCFILVVSEYWILHLGLWFILSWFVYRVNDGVNTNLVHVAIWFSKYHLLKRLSFLQYMLLALISIISWLQIHGFIYGLSIPLVFLYLGLFVFGGLIFRLTQCFCYIGSIVYLETRLCDTSGFVLFL
jgi:hypothetical protein